MQQDANTMTLSLEQQPDTANGFIGMTDIRPEHRILDLGCGTGTFTRVLARLAERGHVVGIDDSAEHIRQAQADAASGDNATFLHMPSDAMRFSEDFDLVVSQSSFQWMKNQRKVIAESYEALRKGGRFFLRMPARDFGWEMNEALDGAFASVGMQAAGRAMQPPWRFPLAEEMADYLRDARFRDVDTRYEKCTLRFGSSRDVIAWGMAVCLPAFLPRVAPDLREKFKRAFAKNFEYYRSDDGIAFSFRRLYASALK
jgi:SAM-dependent methyltransferase